MRVRKRSTDQPRGRADLDDALAVAVRLFRSPGLVHHIRRSPLPQGVTLVIRVAAGCPISCAKAAKATGFDEHVLMRLASLYLLVALFGNEEDARRTLGLNPGSSAEEMHENRKWLLKWLHPDRNRSRVLAGFSVRVLAASAKLSEASRVGPSEVQVVAPVERARFAVDRRVRSR